MITKFFTTFILSGILFYWGCGGMYKQEYRKAYALLQKKELDSIEKAVKKFDEAIRYAVAALQGKYEALMGLGAKYMELKMYSDATKVFLEASKIKPEEPSVYYFLGLSYANLAQVSFSLKEKDTLNDLAETAYKHGEKIDPSHLSLQYALGVFYGLVRKDPRRGVQYLSRILEKSPLHVDSLFASGRLYMEIGKWSEAWTCYEKIEKHYPGTDVSRKAKENLERIRRVLR